MGYLDNTSITVDAILTKKGREILAKGADEFKITQFALADDEIDYSLWNPAHSLGSNYYGIAIDNMPLIEAIPDETQTMKYKLVTLRKSTTRIPVITVPNSTITLVAGGDAVDVSPNTSNFEGGNSTLGYTAILSNSDVAFLEVGTAVKSVLMQGATVPTFVGDDESAQSVSAVGFSFRVVAKNQPIQSKTATLTIIGNETGGRATVTVTVNKQQVATSGGDL
jgi:hypothetical protein|tara:strand:+ start:63 stop:731 length:669 start_codon:yes stop_codon:yes gene_type:complete